MILALLIAALSQLANAGTNNLGLEHKGTINLSHVNKFQTALSGDHVPRDSFGNVNDIAANLGVAFNRWASLYSKQISLTGSIGGNSVNLKAPTSPPSPYGLTMPSALPAATSTLRVSSAGAVSYGSATNGAVTSSSSGAFLTHTLTPVQVTNLSVTLTTTGRPVKVLCQGDGSQVVSGFFTGSFVFQSGSGAAAIFIYRDGSMIAAYPTGQIYAPGAIAFLDTTAAAGSHTYAIYGQAGSTGTPTLQVYYTTLSAYEI